MIPTGDALIAELKTITDDAHIDEIRRRALAEQERRRTLLTAEADVAQLNEKYVAAIGRQDGEEWVQTASHDGYTKGEVVAVGADYYRSTYSGPNTWEPGSGLTPWEMVWPDGAGGWVNQKPGGGAIPWAPGISAVKDVTLVTYGGFTWRAKLDHVTHEGWVPSDATHAVWEKVQ